MDSGQKKQEYNKRREASILGRYSVSDLANNFANPSLTSKTYVSIKVVLNQYYQSMTKPKLC